MKSRTEYMGERQDQMQELNRQRQEAIRYIQDICKAVMWFANTFQGKSFRVQSGKNTESGNETVTVEPGIPERGCEEYSGT